MLSCTTEQAIDVGDDFFTALTSLVFAYSPSGVQKSFCMSITISAVFCGSKERLSWSAVHSARREMHLPLQFEVQRPIISSTAMNRYLFLINAMAASPAALSTLVIVSDATQA